MRLSEVGEANRKDYKLPLFNYINIIPGDPYGLPDVF